jgi:hypothetical protein
MKRILALVLLGSICCTGVTAQQKIDRTNMTYLIGVKPNNIVYHDTLYSGSKQFRSLFYRTNDPELILYYDRHQSNKIAGQVLSITGTIATIVGIGMVTSGNSDKGTGWIVLGTGFATTLTGGYLIFKGQQNLMNAVVLFNHKYNRPSVGIGVGDRQAGLVLKF